MKELEIVSTIDGSPEPSLFYFPEGDGDVPLVVGLHGWNSDRFAHEQDMLPRCRERGWALLLPEFRGNNTSQNPRARQAMGSKLARQDVIDAVNKVSGDCAVNRDLILLLGGSGGGHMSLMLAAYAPKLWKTVSAWVPITDLVAWHSENPEYAPRIVACAGGCPGDSPEVDKEYRDRSPITYARELAKVNLSIHHGRYDELVPYTHSWRLAQEIEKAGPERFFFEIFDGGHEIRLDVAFAWFDQMLDAHNGKERPSTA